MIRLRRNAAQPGYDQLVFKRRRPPSSKQWPGRGNEGWDTETVEGKATTLANSTEYFEINSLSDILKEIGRERHKNKRHVWWNLRYDVTAMFKWEPEVLTKLELEGVADYDGYEFYYLPRKFLKIRSSQKRTFYHYDIAQFYRMPLARAAKRYLNRDAPDIKTDRADLSGYTSTEVGEYCRWDAESTKLLGDLYVKQLATVDLHPKHLISAGNIAQQMLVATSDIPCWAHQPNLATRMAWMAQRGAWIDVWKRGEATVWKYDIKSAYPSEMRDMPDIRDGRWTFEENPKDSAYGFVRTTIEYAPGTPPFLAHYDGKTNIFPDLDVKTRAVITQKEFNYLKSIGCTLKPDIWYSFIPNDNPRYPWRDPIDRFYKIKEEEGKKKGTRWFDAAKYLVAKELFNSPYGKTCERIKQDDGSWRPGTLFLPTVSSHILAGARLKLAKAIRGYEKEVVNIATDSMCVTRPVAGLDGSGDLGSWVVEAEGEPGIFLQPGRYQVGDEDPMTRGFSLRSMRDSGYNDYWQMAKAGGTMCKILIDRPYTGRQAARWGKIDKANIFTRQEYYVTPHNTRRLWDKQVDDFSQLLNTTIGSTPIPISMAETTAK